MSPEKVILPVSVTVLTFNEEENIAGCLDSVSWASEIIVVDSGSEDKTVEICGKYTDKIFHKDWAGFVEQKNFATSKCSFDWVFNIDADERVSPELEESILNVFGSGEKGVYAAFMINFRSRYLGRWIYHCGWYPDYKPRLFNRNKAQWEGEDPHAMVVPRGRTKKIKGDILHYVYKNISSQINTIQRYSDTSLHLSVKKGRNPRLLTMVFHPVVKFIETYIVKRGFLDGFAGFVISVNSSFYVFCKHAKLWEYHKKHR
ncbi:MAG: glycosyltransferase family 2 protein [Candidatus Aureabacteria bacterium]|nr:glycosyltransferase family 2 protein [Candidatus Auribacterota bacterium]